MEILHCGDASILFVMAAEAEYGSELRKRFDPLLTGVGPVEAGVVTGTALAELSSAGKKPDLLVSLGSAGSRKLPQTEIFQASSVSYRDMDATPLGFDKGVTPFLDMPACIELPILVPDVPAASLSTGANIVADGAAYAAIQADMVDMESYACVRAAMLHDVPVVILRGISDGAEELQQIDDWTKYLAVIDGKLAGVVDNLVAALDKGMLLA